MDIIAMAGRIPARAYTVTLAGAGMATGVVALGNSIGPAHVTSVNDKVGVGALALASVGALTVAGTSAVAVRAGAATLTHIIDRAGPLAIAGMAAMGIGGVASTVTGLRRDRG